MSFANLKRNSSTSFDKINKEMEKLSQKGNYSSDDDKYWKPTVDAAGNGYAVIRFLPQINEEDMPWVMVWDHGFQGPGGWYIEKSLTTLGKDDPVSAYNSKLWNSTQDDGHPNRKKAREQKRRLAYYSNIFVVSDPKNPENEGKVLMYKYGKKIFDKIKDVMHPEFEDEEPVNPFDMWNGANFKIKIRQVDGWRNYDKSEFDEQSALNEDDSVLEDIYGQMHNIQNLIDPTNFKSYDALKQKMHKVLGENVLDAETKDKLQEEQTVQAETKSEPTPSATATSAASDSDDDDLEFFKNFATDD